RASRRARPSSYSQVNLESPAIGTSQPACSGGVTYSWLVDKRASRSSPAGPGILRHRHPGHPGHPVVLQRPTYTVRIATTQARTLYVCQGPGAVTGWVRADRRLGRAGGLTSGVVGSRAALCAVRGPGRSGLRRGAEVADRADQQVEAELEVRVVISAQ